jgi:AraC-like DNA-binding protein
MAQASRRPPPDPYMRSGEPLLWWGGAGAERRPDASYYFDCRRRLDRPHAVIQITLSGCGFYRRSGRRQLLPANHAFIDLIPSAFEYGHAPESEGPYELAFVSFSGPVAERWTKRAQANFGRVLDFGADRSVADQIVAMAQREDQPGAPPDRYQASAMLYALLMQVHSVLMRSRMEQAPRVRQATALIEQHGRDPRFSVATLAQQLDCSREHLTRQFHMATGVSPSKYLSQHRLSLVARELRAGEEKLDAIARRCGFSGANYLCRAFRQRWGLTPAQYRASPGMMLLP